MEEKGSEQTNVADIDQQPSTSSIDQITKVPTSKPKAKNPKRVAAGKRLSQYNKKARQTHDAVVKEEQNLIQENRDDDGGGGDQWLPKTSFTSIIALLGLGLTAIDLFLRYKSQRSSVKIDDNSQIQNIVVSSHRGSTDSINNLEFIGSVETDLPKSFGGME